MKNNNFELQNNKFEFTYEFETETYYDHERGMSESDSEEYTIVLSHNDLKKALVDIFYNEIKNHTTKTKGVEKQIVKFIISFVLENSYCLEHIFEEYEDELRDYFYDEAKEQWQNYR